MSILSIEIPDELLQRLQALAREHSTSLDELVQDVLLEYVDEENWENEPSIDDIKRMVEEAIRDYQAGKLKSIDEVLEELEQDFSEANKEEILSNMKASLKEALSGKASLALDAIAELRQELAEDAD